MILFFEIMLTKSDSECDKSESDIALVDVDHKLSIHETCNDLCE